MTNLIHQPTSSIIPVPRCSINVRAAVKEDLPFIDALMKMHSHMVGFATRGQIEKNIEDGQVLIAEEMAMARPGIKASGHQGIKGEPPPGSPNHSMPPLMPGCLDASLPQSIQVGYVIAKYEYMKRDEVGIVYQLNVMPIRHRHLVGASLIKAVFDRAPYGCRLFCCWCAQDIQANWFWESIGFVPLAFRTGSRAKQRIHIFWQRRVRDNDDSTPYWFPAKTEGGAVGEDRIVLPIPPDTHWRDAKPTVLPGLPPPPPETPLMLPGGQPVRVRSEAPKLTRSQRAAMARSQSAHLGASPLGKKAVIRGGRIRYVDVPGFDPSTDGPDELAPPVKAKKPRAPRQKNDPKYIAAARELRDRYLEQINTERMLPPAACGKYDVSRQLEAAPTAMKIAPVAMLEAA